MENVTTATGELSAAKKILLEKLVQSVPQELPMEPVIPRLEHSGPMPMSFAQQRLWFLEQLAPGNPVYNVFEALHLSGTLNVPALQHGLSEIVRRHESLRTVFGDQDGAPVQSVRPPVELKLEMLDLRSTPAEEQEACAQKICNEEAARPFNLERDLMIRATLLKLHEEEHVLLVTMHHIASDGWSIGVLLRELAAFYNAALEGKTAALPELPIQYPDFAAWQHQMLDSRELQAQAAYWQRQLAGAPELLEFPADRPRPAVQTFRGGVEWTTLSPALSKRLKEISRGQSATLFMTLLAAFNALLHRLSRQTDIVVGTPIAGRNHSETENLIGFFINTLAIRADLSNNPSFRELLRRVRETTLDAFANQDLPFDKLVAELKPQRSPSHTPIVQVLFAFQNGLGPTMEFKGLTLRRRRVRNGTAKFDFTVMMVDTPEGLVTDIEYNRDLFDAETMASMARRFEVLLEGIAEDPDRPLSELPLLSAAEHRQLLEDWNRTARDYPREKSVQAIFEEQVQARPHALAVQADKRRLSYAELNSRANQLAHELQEQGVRAGECVGIYLERGLEMVISMLAILKAGAAYLPLDRAFPKERLAFMLQDANVRLLISAKAFVEHLPTHRARVLQLDTEAKRIHARSSSNPANTTNGESLAYVIYTSGSTGLPKGACVTHRGIARLVVNTDYAQLDAHVNIAQVSNCSFDAATFEIWGALLNGARLTILPSELVLSPLLFQRALQKHQVTTLFLTTSLFNLFAREMPNAFAELSQVLIGGEAADPQCCLEVLKAAAPGALINCYGPTETTVFATVYKMKSAADVGRNIPIGRPIANGTVYILDEYMHPVPAGVPGELCIGGDGVGLGYLNRPELTRQKFVANPFGPGRLYKTGDLVRYLRDGTIEFLGRLDLQVKIRGFRVELGEIEEVLGRHPAVKQNAVMMREEAPGQKVLVAYVVAQEKQEACPALLTRYLKERLPDYMVPSIFMPLPELPLNANGKVDRRALPEPLGPKGTETYQAPRDPLERQMAAIWEEVLHCGPIGLHDNFFQLGGHSLLAVQLVLRLEKVLGKRLLVSTLFQAPTLEQLAGALRDGEARSASAIVEVQGGGAKPPLFLVHGVGGGMFWGYRNLSRYLGGDQPVYVIRSRAMDGREEEYEQIEDMAGQYVAELRAFHPQGPYYLGGYCFGGNVAYEMARQLTAQGESVAFLALMNCAPPNSSYIRVCWTPGFALKFVRNLALLAGNALQWRPEQRREFIYWKARLLRQKLRRWFGRRQQGTRGGPLDHLVDLSIYPPEQRRLWETHIQALINYHPKPYPGGATLFRARAHPFLCSFDPLCGWGNLATAGVNLKLVKGPHEGILDEPHVQILAREMKACLEAVTNPKILPRGQAGDAPPDWRAGVANNGFASEGEQELTGQTLIPNGACTGTSEFGIVDPGGCPAMKK